jgi:hypothetical protein
VNDFSRYNAEKFDVFKRAYNGKRCKQARERFEVYVIKIRLGRWNEKARNNSANKCDKKYCVSTHKKQYFLQGVAPFPFIFAQIILLFYSIVNCFIDFLAHAW